MTMEWGEILILASSFFLVAFLYSSVGFGGGSSYLALLALTGSSFFLIRSTALVCNLIVVSGSCLLYYRAGHLRFKQFIPFILASVPMAFLGASFTLKEHVFFGILGIVLVFVAIALVVQTLNLKSNFRSLQYASGWSYGIGAGIGLLSGMVGIGGGIFLAPVLNYMKWGQPLRIAALASFFILVNSISGIFGLVASGTFEVLWPELAILIFMVLLGGQLGVRMALVKISPRALRLFTALLVFFVGIRVLIFNGLQINLLV